jgi:trk system potassium uptake protein TrkA
MKIIIIGCGRMGAGLAQTLDQRGHQVVVVDKDPNAFERLAPSLRDRFIVGIGFDREVLLKAGVERADGLAAVTASDEANVVTARLARQVFHMPRVVARVYDPRKAEIYQRLGLQTISTTTWGINRIAELLCYSELDTVFSLGNGQVELAEVEVPPLLVGRTVSELTMPGQVHVVSISRVGKTFLAATETVFETGDRVHLAVMTGALNRLHAMLEYP